LDQLRSARPAAVRRSPPRSRLNFRCASKLSRERKLNVRRRTLVTPTAARVQLLYLTTPYLSPPAINPRASGLGKMRAIVSIDTSELHRLLVPLGTPLITPPLFRFVTANEIDGAAPAN
jgi:hypothetical protein